MLRLITCHGPLLAELLFLSDTTTDDSFSNRPCHGKTCLWTYVEREGPDQSAHPHSLIRVFTVPSRKHAYIMLTPLNWGLHGYTVFYLFLLKNIDCGYSLELPRRGGSNEYPQSMF